MKKTLVPLFVLMASLVGCTSVEVRPPPPPNQPAKTELNPKAPMPWASRDAAGRLRYRTTARGDRIMDFSSAGYGGGGVALPIVPYVETLAPSGGDDTAQLQAAVDRIGARPLAAGFRGALQLAAGTFHCSSVIALAQSGVVVRGAGAGLDGTVIQLTGEPHVAFDFGPAQTSRGTRDGTTRVRITDPYVPSGTTGLTVADGTGFQAGDAVLVLHPITPEWIKFMGMAGLVRNGKPEHWISGTITIERRVKSVTGNHVELDLPLPDALDAAFLGQAGAELVKAEPPPRLTQIGLEHLGIVSPPQHLTLGERAFSGLRMRDVEDVWVQDVALRDTMDTVQIGAGSRRVTIEKVTIDHRTAITGAALPADFELGGSQILVDRCQSKGDRLFYVATGAEANGPNVVLRCEFSGDGSIMPHQRWATGLLVDSCQVPQGSIQFINRGEMGSGHGWTIGWAVAWNCSAPTFVIQNPPGALNWAIGCTGAEKLASMPFGKGPMLPQGVIELSGQPVEPASLYLAQLAERLGRNTP